MDTSAGHHEDLVGPVAVMSLRGSAKEVEERLESC
jgi:hypothetical protein